MAERSAHGLSLSLCTFCAWLRDKPKNLQRNLKNVRRNLENLRRSFENVRRNLKKRPTKLCCPMVENQLFPHKMQQKRVESLHRPRARGRKLAVDSLFRGYDRVEEILDVRKLIRFWGFEFKTSRSGNSQFNLNMSLAPEQILFDCSADGLSFAFGVAGYVENQRETRCQQGNER